MPAEMPTVPSNTQPPAVPRDGTAAEPRDVTAAEPRDVTVANPRDVMEGGDAR